MTLKMELLSCYWASILVLLITRPDISSSKKSSNRGKCSYNIVIHEVDSAVKCPKITDAGYDEQKKVKSKLPWLLADEPDTKSNEVVVSRFSHHAYRLGLEDLVKRVGSLETKLYAEMAENRELKNTLLLQEQSIRKMDRYVHQSLARNLTQIGHDIRHVTSTMTRHAQHYRSLDTKLSEVMLDVAEVNHYLANAEERRERERGIAGAPGGISGRVLAGRGNVGYHDDGRGGTTQKDITVQSPSLMRNGCAVDSNSTKFRDCAEIYKSGHKRSGVYYITPIYSPCPIPVYCDMDTPPGGWLLLQRRMDGATSFNRNWYGYRMGFGNIMREFWLGLDNIFLLTNQKEYSLRVDLWDFSASRVFAEYKTFKIDGERDRFRLHIHNYTGTAGDGLTHHHGVYFSTPDSDNDAWDDYHCAKEWTAGWWFNNCWFVILNGKYYNTTRVKYRGISWNDWKAEQLEAVEMKIRPTEPVDDIDEFDIGDAHLKPLD